MYSSLIKSLLIRFLTIGAYRLGFPMVLFKAASYQASSLRTGLHIKDFIVGFDKSERFIIEDYPSQKPFSSFLPGIAGLYGIPMWVFYTNRAQAIAGFGVESKDSPIMEFQPANKAYQTTAYTGFRTFITTGNDYYEPFSPLSQARRSSPAGRRARTGPAGS